MLLLVIKLSICNVSTISIYVLHSLHCSAIRNFSSFDFKSQPSFDLSILKGFTYFFFNAFEEKRGKRVKNPLLPYTVYVLPNRHSSVH